MNEWMNEWKNKHTSTVPRRMSCDCPQTGWWEMDDSLANPVFDSNNSIWLTPRCRIMLIASWLAVFHSHLSGIYDDIWISCRARQFDTAASWDVPLYYRTPVMMTWKSTCVRRGWNCAGVNSACRQDYCVYCMACRADGGGVSDRRACWDAVWYHITLDVSSQWWSADACTINQAILLSRFALPMHYICYVNSSRQKAI